MTDRESDRVHPERLREQAAVALAAEANRELSPAFRRVLAQGENASDLFWKHELARTAQSGLEVQISGLLITGSKLKPLDAVEAALRDRGSAYLREHRIELIADREPCVEKILKSASQAWSEAAPVVAKGTMEGSRTVRSVTRVQIDENLLPSPSSGGHR